MKEGNKLLMTTAKELMNFSLRELIGQLKKHTPSLYELVLNIVSNKRTDAKKDFLAATIVTKILGVFNQKMSAWRYVQGFVLDSGGSKDNAIHRLANSKDSVSPQQLRRKLTEISGLTNDMIKDWDVPSCFSSIAFDNVNPYVKPRHQTMTRGNKIYNMTHALMIKHRVDTSNHSSEPLKTISQLKPDDVLPQFKDYEVMTSCFERIIRNAWAENIPAMSWMAEKVPLHEHSTETACPTEFVS